MKTLLCSLLLAFSVFGQATINAPAIDLTAEANTIVLTWMNTQNTGVSTTIPGAINNSTTSITVASSTGIAVNSVIVIGTEHIGVGGVAGNVLTVQRGFNGTTAAAHSAGATVKELKYRTLNLLGKAAVVDALRAIVRSAKQTTVATAAAQVETETAAAVQ